MVGCMLATSLAIAPAILVAQTADWVPTHLYATIRKAYEHQGFSFVKIIMRCPKFMPESVDAKVSDKEHINLLTHENGVPVDDATARIFSHKTEHDPSNIVEARKFAHDLSMSHLGLFYQNPEALRYDLYGAHNLNFTPEQKIAAINRELERFVV